MFAIVQLALYMSRTTFKDNGVLMMIVDPCVQPEGSSSKNAAMKLVGRGSNSYYLISSHNDRTAVD